MPQYVAFLRAINVGGHIVKMDALRRMFETLGLANVQTFIASGNVLFDAPAKNTATLETQIETYLKGALGYEVATFLRTPDEVIAAVAHSAFPAGDMAATSVMYVGFMRNALDAAALGKLMALANDIDHFQVHGRELYWLAHRHLGESPVTGARLERTLQAPLTLRNITSVRKLAAKHFGGQ